MDIISEKHLFDQVHGYHKAVPQIKPRLTRFDRVIFQRDEIDSIEGVV